MNKKHTFTRMTKSSEDQLLATTMSDYHLFVPKKLPANLKHIRSKVLKMIQTTKRIDTSELAEKLHTRISVIMKICQSLEYEGLIDRG